MKNPIETKQAPAALGPYSQAIQAGSTLYISGQLGIDPNTGEFAAPDAPGQAKQSLANICAILKAAGLTPGHVVKTTVLLADMKDFAAVNAIYGEIFNQAPPARSCFAVKDLPKGGKVEIEAIAVGD